MSDFKVKSMFDDPFEYRWLYYIDKKGRMVFKARGFIELMKDSFTDNVAHGLIQLDWIYKWGKLKKSGYEIELNPQSVSIITGGKIYRYESAISIKDIHINYGDKKESLISYVNGKFNNISTHEVVRKALFQREGIQKDKVFNSRELNQLLSYSLKIDNYWKILNGEENIFESDELLDQLLVLIMVLHARYFHDKSTEMILLLLEDHIENYVKNLFNGYKKDEVDLLIDEAKTLAFQIITDNKHLTRKNDRFEPNLQSSLHFFLLAPIARGGRRFVSKIQEHLSDRRVNLDKNKYILSESSFKSNNQEDGNIEILDGLDPIAFPRLISDLQMESIINKLLPQDQNIFKLCYMEGLRLDDIGLRLSLGKSAVSKRLKKIEENVRKQIEST